MEITWKAALFALIGLFVLATVAMNNSAFARLGTEKKVATRGALPNSICNILYPIPCSYVQPW
jgi:hypothetical protein